MKKLTQSEQGYTLLLTVAVIVIFTILGLGLITLTSSGIKKNEVRQNTVQARDLSDKGIKYAVNDIQLFLEKEIKNNPMGKTQFYTLLSNTLQVNCPNGIEIPGENTSKTKVCIDNVAMISNEEKDRYKRLVTFKSTGLVNGKTHTTTSKVIIGTDAIPDQLRYALSTNDEGDMYLHGGVEVLGDIKTDGNLIIAKNAHWMSGSTAVWEESVGPRLIKDTKSVSPKIIMRPSDDKNIYNIYIVKSSSSIDNNKHIDYDKHIKNTNNYLYTRSLYNKIIPIDTNAAASVANNLLNTPNLSIVTKTLPADKIEVSEKIKEKTKNTVDHYHGDLNINGNNNPTQYYQKDDTILLAGNMTTIGDNINLKGTYYIKGNLTINKTNLKSDALIYVNGKVEITESTLQGINSNSTLIIFANGDINISNISQYNSTPSSIKGFFYTKSDMTMYGVGSNIRLTGGISSKRLILTALRGNTTKKGYDWYGNLHLNVDSLDNQKLRDSRLKITYDENLIQQYTSFTRDQKEEYITQLNDPEYIQRSN